MNVAITGHRPDKLGYDYNVKFKYYSKLYLWIYEEIEAALLSLGMKEGKINNLISGMAIGVDMIFATAAMRLEIPLVAAIPFKGQESRWNKESKEFYNKIINNPLTTVITVSTGSYEAWKMQRRNEWMVDNCDVLIAVWDGSSGGTANCVKYAQKMKKKIIYINPKDFE